MATKPLDGQLEMDESILGEAKRLTVGDRQKDYGHPRDNFEHIAGLWRAHFKWDVSARDVAAAMRLVKEARQKHSPKRDNLIDIAGYANTEDMLSQAPTKAEE